MSTNNKTSKKPPSPSVGLSDLLCVTVYDGKYTVKQYSNGRVEALRYGEKWRDCTGDGLILALVQRIYELENA